MEIMLKVFINDISFLLKVFDWNTANSSFVNHKGKDVNFDWLIDQWDE